jgi:hypothetical protein
MRRVLTAA